MKDLFSISGKPIVITGGLGQLGREFTRLLLKKRARVAIFDKSPRPKNLKTLFKTSLSPKTFHYAQADVTNRKSLESAVKSLPKSWGKIFGLINNAALDSPPNRSEKVNCRFEDYSEKEWDQVMSTNAKGSFLACQVIGKEMAKNRAGSIINVSSIYGTVSPDQRIYAYRQKKGQGFFKPVAYSASKSALYNLTRYLATHWAKKNVRVNTVTFGGVRNGQDKKFLKGYSARVPMGRMAKPTDYNGAILFLLSEASSYMTGSNLVIDGGYTCW